MMRRLYILTEGVTDAVFVGRVLSVAFGCQRVSTLNGLDRVSADWVRSFKWPVQRRTGEYDISRLSVPAPIFYRLSDRWTIAIRNAMGIGEVRRVLDLDREYFERAEDSKPAAWGLIVDSDNDPPEAVFARAASAFTRCGLPIAVQSGKFNESGDPLTGVLVLPGRGEPGTLEDLLLPLGAHHFPHFHNSAAKFVEPWEVWSRTTLSDELLELRKPAGAKKAVLSAMAALLKPMKPFTASLEDQVWVSEESLGLPELQPCVEFFSILRG